MSEKIQLPESIHQFPTRQDYVDEYYQAIYEYLDSLPPRVVAKTISLMCIQSSRLNLPKGDMLDDAINFWKSTEMLSFVAELVKEEGTREAILYLAELPKHIEESLEEQNAADDEMYAGEPLAPKIDATGHVIHDDEDNM